MAAGLQIFDAIGGTVVDTTTSIVTLLGAQDISANSGSVTVDSSLGTIWFSLQIDSRIYLDGLADVDITVSGNNISWNWRTHDSNTLREPLQEGTFMFYGVY